MKKVYEAPTVEKIAFNYREQVVAASGGETDVPGNPSIGGWTNTPGASGCKWYVAEAIGQGWCDII